MIKSAAAWSEVRHDWSSSAIRSPFAGATGSRAPAGRSSRLGAPCLPLPQALPGLPDVLAVTWSLAQSGLLRREGHLDQLWDGIISAEPELLCGRLWDLSGLRRELRDFAALPW